MNPTVNWPPAPPTPANVQYSSPWGRVRGDDRHRGVDIPVASGTPVLCPTKTMTLTKAIQPEDAVGGCGGEVMLKCRVTNVKVRFCHLKMVTTAPINTQFTEHTHIGDSGGAAGDPGAGSSTGAHLHYEVYANDSIYTVPLPEWWDVAATSTTDPARFMSQANVETYGIVNPT